MADATWKKLAYEADVLGLAVQAGAITDSVTKAPTHDAVFDVKTTADAALPKAGGTMSGDIAMDTLILGTYHDYGHDAAVTLVPGTYRLMKQTVDAATAFTITDPGSMCTFELWMVQSGAGPYTPTWTGGGTVVHWGDNDVPYFDEDAHNYYAIFKRIAADTYLGEWRKYG